MSPVKVLVLWADPDSPNLGVRALAQGIRDLLPDSASVTFASHRKPLDSGSLSLKRLGIAAVWPWGQVKSELAQYDLIIDVGEGDSFASIYGAKRFAKMLAGKLAAANARRPPILAPQTLGPWESAWSRSAGRLAMKKAKAVWARDSDSLARARAAGFEGVMLGSDLVFAIRDQPERTPSNGLVLNVSGLLWEENRHVDSRVYQATVRTIIEKQIERGSPVSLLPHVLAGGERDDDTEISEMLGSEYPDLKVHRPTTLGAARSIVAGATVLVGSRMHACLNALSLGVPTVPLAYSDKFDSLFRDLGYNDVLDLRSNDFRVEAVLDLVGDNQLAISARRARAEGQRRIAKFAIEFGE